MVDNYIANRKLAILKNMRRQSTTYSRFTIKKIWELTRYKDICGQLTTYLNAWDN